MPQRNPDLIAAEQAGIFFPPEVVDFIKPEWKYNYQRFAMDAQPGLVTVQNSGIPAFLATVVDPDILTVITAKNQAAEVFGEVRKGSFVDVAAMFPVVEHTGEVSSYGDFSADGRASANMNFPQRESYNYQTIIEYGELEMERAGLARIDWASKLRVSATIVLNKFQNLTYFYGVQGLQNYGLLNDPSLLAPIAPGVKTAGGVAWFVNGTPNATANEVYNDVIALATKVINQSSGTIDAKSKMTLGLSPQSGVALTFTNTFNVNVEDLLKKNFPNLTVKTAVQYGALSAQNPQGSAGGEIVQLIVDEVEGQETGYCAFNEKLRAGKIVPQLSGFQQKFAQGTWGAIVRQPFAISQMIGV